MAFSWMTKGRKRWSSTRRTSTLSEVREGGMEGRRDIGGREGRRERDVRGKCGGLEAYASTHARAFFCYPLTVPHHYDNVEDYLVHYQKVRSPCLPPVLPPILPRCH
jgi:hypothetical protein